MALAAFGDHAADLQGISNLCYFDGQTIRTDKDFIRAVFQERYGSDFGWAPRVTHSEDIARLTRMFGPLHKSGDQFEKQEFDFAHSGQSALEEALVRFCVHLRSKYDMPNLCIAGGVGLNISANTRILAESGFSSLFIQPAAGDDGQALGRLLFRMHSQGRLPRSAMTNAYFGPSYSEGEVRAAVQSLSAFASITEYPSSAPLNRALASLLAQGKIAARFSGRSEIGPRALGNRSILADPRQREMAGVLNAVKHREPFQPFALSILEEHAHRWFRLPGKSPFMLFSGKASDMAVRNMPGGIHVDNTSRLQTVSPEQNAGYYDLINAFMEITGVPAIINTSFNDKGEPMVETPADATNAFRRMGGIDVLSIGNILIRRNPTCGDRPGASQDGYCLC